MGRGGRRSASALETLGGDPVEVKVRYCLRGARHEAWQELRR